MFALRATDPNRLDPSGQFGSKPAAGGRFPSVPAFVRALDRAEAARGGSVASRVLAKIEREYHLTSTRGACFVSQWAPGTGPAVLGSSIGSPK